MAPKKVTTKTAAELVLEGELRIPSASASQGPPEQLVERSDSDASLSGALESQFSDQREPANLEQALEQISELRQRALHYAEKQRQTKVRLVEAEARIPKAADSGAIEQKARRDPSVLPVFTSLPSAPRKESKNPFDQLYKQRMGTSLKVQQDLTDVQMRRDEASSRRAEATALTFVARNGERIEAAKAQGTS